MANSTVIFGATGGIGGELARQLVRDDRSVLLSGRDPERLPALAEELGCPSAPADATNPEQVEAVLRQAHEQLGPVDGVAHCVGSILLRPLHSTSDESWDEVLHTNLTSAFVVLRASVKAMRRSQTGGSIVLFSSVAARVGLPNHEAIAAAKGAIEAMARSAAATYAREGIRVNVVAPGLVKTPGAAALVNNEVSRKHSERLHPLGRLGEPGEVASLAHWLLSPQALWVTGQVFGMDGGLGSLRVQTPSA